jgi:hypothetical protein
MEVTGKGSSKSEGGFPILPGGTRRVSIDWTGEDAPQNVSIRFREFAMKLPVTTAAE